MYAYNPDLKEIYYQSVEGSSIERGIYAIKINGKGKRILQATNGQMVQTLVKKDLTTYIHIPMRKRSKIFSLSNQKK